MDRPKQKRSRGRGRASAGEVQAYTVQWGGLLPDPPLDERQEKAIEKRLRELERKQRELEGRGVDEGKDSGKRP